MELNKNEIAEKLKNKGVLLPCHRCGTRNFSILDGYSKISIQKNIEDLPNTIIGGFSVPVILIACSNCGAITSHAIGAIDPDLLLKGDKKNA